MPISTQCPYCQKKFRAADKVAGKAVKCPGCQGVVRVPGVQGVKESSDQPGQLDPSDSSWYIRSENGEQMGPVSKEQLDNLATKGRLSFCKVRRSDWNSWKWADDVYPELPSSKQKAEVKPSPSDSSSVDSSRLVTCPDCGNTVSRRATQCPHCGCPAAVLQKRVSQDGPVAVSPPPPPPVPDAAKAAAVDAAVEAVGSKPSSGWKPYLIAGGIILLVTTIGTPLYLWWWLHSATEQVAEQLGVSLSEPEPPPIPEPEEPSEEMLSPDGKRECIDEAAQRMAEYIDEFQSQYHLPLSMIGQTVEIAESAKMLQALAGGDLDAIPDSTGVVPGGSGIEPYKSQAKELFTECRDWVRENVKRGPCTEGDVWETAQQWARDKQAEILKPLGGLPVEGLTPPVVPEGPQGGS